MKILFAALVCFLFVFSLIVMGGFFWISSVVRKNHRGPVVSLPESRPRLQADGTFVRPPPLFPPAAAKNAILAAKTNSLPGDDIFRDVHIPRLQITIPREGMSSLSREERKYVRATIQEGNTVYKDVAIRVKGGPGSHRDLRDYPSFTVNFDEFAPGQKFHGLKKIHLNNSVQDGGHMEEKICRELFEAAGVPVPRAGNAYVTFNGRVMGMYVLVEGINKQFLKRYFKDATGNVYDGKSGMDITTDHMQVNSGDNPTDHTGRRKLVAAVRQPVADGARLAALEKNLDVDRFLSFMALEMILWHWDGYTMARNNWRVFHDRDAERMVFIPQGVDQMFNNLGGPFIPEQPNGMVARAVLQVPELRDRYYERLTYIATNVFLPDAINNRILEVADKIQEVLAEMESPGAADNHRQIANKLRGRVKRRANYLQAQLFPTPSVAFDPSGAVALADWQFQVDIPEATPSREKDENGHYILGISGKNCTASWRTSLLLPRGRYRFEGRLKTKGVVLDPEPRAGAGLRISGHRTLHRNDGDRDWTDIFFDFEVSDPERDTTLVCELRANEGTVWFDASSLKLRRL